MGMDTIPELFPHTAHAGRAPPPLPVSVHPSILRSAAPVAAPLSSLDVPSYMSLVVLRPSASVLLSSAASPSAGSVSRVMQTSRPHRKPERQCCSPPGGRISSDACGFSASCTSASVKFTSDMFCTHTWMYFLRESGKETWHERGARRTPSILNKDPSCDPSRAACGGALTGSRRRAACVWS
ncbi:hypothetical protein EYF80_044527 [Liparis tanakae]|uniref:Uncharacterized protein n=1 Tax=Liparis tanakae TaxID=230148 RepID=A0A4Z2FVP6_9TELE|nr:hypothetical protein EYF80_044527 [Liparis tanakae]